MLVITRKPGESFYLGTDIQVTMVRVRGNQVRLAIHAPRSVRIRREEVSPSRPEWIEWTEGPSQPVST